MAAKVGERTRTPGEGRPRDGRSRRRVSVVGIIGELFLTGGVLVLLFLGWQLWLNNIIVGNQENHISAQLNQKWEHEALPTTPPTSEPTTIPVLAEPANAQRWGILMVPRWGADFKRPIGQGVGVADVLDKIGVGHYPQTPMPGAIGNVAIASHRKAYGGAFENLHKLHIGDQIFIETKDGWYEYRFRNLQYVLPTEVNVLQPVPEQPGVQPTQRLLTMTTCNPFWSTRERIAAYSLFYKFYPRAGGPPAAIAATVNSKA